MKHFNITLTDIQKHATNLRSIVRAILLVTILSGFGNIVSANSESLTIKGVVLNSQNEPLEGASVVIKGTSLFALTDSTGQFNMLCNRKLPVTLLISFLGHSPVEKLVTEQGNTDFRIVLQSNNELTETVITSRRREETSQQVPIPISVVGSAAIEQTGSFNVNRVKELVPSVQLYSSNPRNTTLNIRGMGSTFGLTNDGIDPGVGFYIDGVYYARPAVTALDFIDVERIEVLRGPQGTLFGKNTTAGAFNITTKAPGFTPSATVEASYGNYNFVQAKASLNIPIIKNKLATRIAFSGTQRDGTIYNTRTEKFTNTLNNLGFRGQLLYVPTERVKVTLIGDYTRQRPDGYAQVLAGVVETRRAAYRQFNNIVTDLGYVVPAINTNKREIDHDTPWKSGNDLGGTSVNIDIKLGPGTLTSTTAWRYWNWDPSNDRDFTGLQGLRKSQAPSVHHQWSQELRYAGDFHKKLSGVIGVYVLGQDLRSKPYHTEEAGRDQWRFSQSSTSNLWATPGLLDGYGIKTTSKLTSLGAAFFGQLDWNIYKGLHVLPGIRLNYDRKKVDFARKTYGGLETEDPALLAIKRSVYSDQEFTTSVQEFNPSGQITVAYQHLTYINAFVTYSASFKPVGINLGGLPNANGEPMIELARVKPEFVNHFEAGIKSTPLKSLQLNGVFHFTDIKDYQTLVQTPDLAVNRGYLANAEKVRVFGAEVDFSYRYQKLLTVTGSFAYTDGRYLRFTNAPPPLEETGGPTFKDISGGRLPGISPYAASLGIEFNTKEFTFIRQQTTFFVGADAFYRSGFSSSPSPSKYLNVKGYALLNARLGIQSTNGLSFFAWVRNATNTKYAEMLLPGAGNAGHYAAVLGDPITFGATVRYSWKAK